jgi:hypothetical protein
MEEEETWKLIDVNWKRMEEMDIEDWLILIGKIMEEESAQDWLTLNGWEWKRWTLRFINSTSNWKIIIIYLFLVYLPVIIFELLCYGDDYCTLPTIVYSSITILKHCFFQPLSHAGAGGDVYLAVDF